MIYKKINNKILTITAVSRANSLILPLSDLKNRFHFNIRSDGELNCIMYGGVAGGNLSGTVTLGQNAKIYFYLLLWDCPALTNKLEFFLQGQCARAQINILSLGGNNDIHRHWLHLYHQSKNTYSRLNFKRILWQRANSYSEEILKIDRGSVGTDTYLSDKAILMGDHSKVISKPSLEILNNEVQASHSAASGRLSEQEIFYLRSRGLDERQAKSLLLDSFIEEVLPPDNHISNLIKQRLNLYARY